MRLKIIIPGLLLPMLAVGALFFGTDAIAAIQGVIPGGGGDESAESIELDADGNPITPPEDALTDEPKATAPDPTAVPSTSEPTIEEPAADAEPSDSAEPSEPVDPGAAEAGVPPPPDPEEPLVTKTNGYLPGREHGIALVKTTRVTSPTHQGWVDMTLDLVLTAYSADPAFAPSIGASADQTSVCFTNTVAPNDCFSVRWGSVEQFDAYLFPNKVSSAVWPVRKAWPYVVTFEVPDNATQASFIYGDNRVEIDLKGDPPTEPVASQGTKPATVPHDAADPVWSAGYYLGQNYGIAVTDVLREAHPSEPRWSRIDVDLSVITYHDGPELDLPLTIKTSSSSTCFTTGETTDCVRVVWGPLGQFDAVLTPNHQSGDIAWPRTRGWPLTLRFPIPSSVLEATLVYDEHEVSLDLRGEDGEIPAWHYQTHYQTLEPGMVMYDQDGQSITLEEIRQDSGTGDAALVFRAINTKENADFYPRVEAIAARVSVAGTVFDGLSDSKKGWSPVKTSGQGRTLAPGQEVVFDLLLPRVVGAGFPALEHTDDRPDAVLLQLLAYDKVTPATLAPTNAKLFRPYNVRFDREKSEEPSWFPDLVVTTVLVDSEVPTASETVDVLFTIQNRGPRAAAASKLQLAVDGVASATVSVSALAAGSETTVKVPWIVTQASVTLDGTVDPDGLVVESSETNNTNGFRFAGGVLPDLEISAVTFSVSSPSVDEKVAVSVTVTNTGKGKAGNSRVIVWLDKSPTVSFFMSYPALAPGASFTADFQWDAKPGPYHMEIQADGYGQVPEESEANNKSEFDHTATMLADLRGVSITTDTPVLYNGLKANLVVSVINDGPGRALDSTVKVYVGAATSPTASFALGRLKAGEIGTGSFTWTVVSGLTAFRVVVDANAVVPETKEDNNEGFFPF